MNKITVFCVCSTPLGIFEVVSLFKNPPEDELSTLPPVRPKAEEIYLYRRGKDSQHGKINF